VPPGAGAVAGRHAASQDRSEADPAPGIDQGIGATIAGGMYQAAKTLLERLLNPIVIASFLVMLLALGILGPRVFEEDVGRDRFK